MRIFITVWLGQVVSTLGSRMTSFAVTIWAWELTGQATALTLLVFFTQLTRLLVTPFAGVIVDRWNRKLLMMFGDAVAGLSTIAILLLFWHQNLHIWHLYLAGALNGTFDQLQELAYSTSIATLVPKQQYSRASSMGYFIGYGSKIFAPALAGALYPVIGLTGILFIDLVTFAIAISSVLFVSIPQPIPEAAHQHLQTWRNLWWEVTSGCRYIFARSGLLALLISTSLFWFAHDLGGAVFAPMLLARTQNDTAVLGSVSAAAGVGGVVGALAMSTWGGPKRRIHGVLLGMVGAGLSKTVFGLGQTLLVWIPAQLCSSLHFPLMGSSEQAIWLAKVRPDIQGRVFAVSALSLHITTSLSYLIAGPLADRVLEPAMQPGGLLVPVLGGIFGTGPGAGMALQYVLTSLCLLLVGAGGYAFQAVLNLEDSIPDHEGIA